MLAAAQRNLRRGEMCCLIVLRKTVNSCFSELVVSVVMELLLQDWCVCELLEEDDSSSSSLDECGCCD